MIILHYTLGFSPNRTGGLVRYVTDVINEQLKQGNKVTALYPGEINLLTSKMYIKKSKNKGIESYKIINSLPLPLKGGIKKPKDFMRKSSMKIFIDFLREINPEVIHIHTIMGIPLEFFEAAKILDIKMIFTTHDYFGLAPEPTFYFENMNYDQNNTVYKWMDISKKSLSTFKLRIFQLKHYALIKNILKKIIKNTRKFKNNDFSSQSYNRETYKDFCELKKYYQNIFKHISVFHFNSNLTEEIYTNNLDFSPYGKVISITDNLNNIEIIAKKHSSKTRIAYIGPNKSYKGFDVFVKLAANMRNDSRFVFKTYGYKRDRFINNIDQNGRYKITELPKIYSDIDILIVPSRWKETFGLVVLESIMCKTPVLLSENVGSKDLVNSDQVFSSEHELENKLKNNNIDYKFTNVKTINTHIKELNALYKD